jgi:hypothetical protein
VISEGCAVVNPNLTDCANERGYLFQSNSSTSWSTQGIQNGVDGAIFSLNTFEEGLLGLTGNASYGYDTVNLGLPGSNLPTIEKQVIAGIWTDDFFLGSLGLSPVPFNFTNLNDPQPSMLGTLRNKSLIPSTSWAYTAGAHYREPPVYGSLTLGGFDATRFQPNNLTFAFGADFSRDLLVSLHSITYDTVGSSPLLASSINMFIDSLVTEIWLPVDVCEAFAQQFNLTWNAQGQLYLVDDAAHTALVAQNPKFTFTIGQTGGSGAIDIVLPYAAFDLSLMAPIVGDNTRYFPLKRAQNSSQYTLGRTFLQEAYVIADYDRRNFSVSQALFPSTSVAQKIVAILPPGHSSNGKRLSGGVIAAIVISILAAILIVSAAALGWSKYRNRSKKDPIGELPAFERAEMPVGKDKPAIFEIDGQHIALPELLCPERHELPSEADVHELDHGRPG